MQAALQAKGGGQANATFDRATTDKHFPRGSSVVSIFSHSVAATVDQHQYEPAAAGRRRRPLRRQSDRRDHDPGADLGF